MLIILALIFCTSINIVNLTYCTGPEKDLTDKVVIVTGAARGIGYGIADNFLKHGVRVLIILDILETKGAEAAEQLNYIYGEGKAVYIKCDVRKDLKNVYKYILDRYERVDVLVNDAGILDEDKPREMFTTNSIALIEWSLKLWEHMRKDKGGCGGTIINLSSMFGYIVHPFLVSYTASKYAVIGFTKSLGHEYNYKKTGVRIVALCPGFTYTAMTAQQMVWDEQLEDFEKLRRASPWQSADDVGRGAVQVFQTAKTGTAWTIMGGEPPIESPVSYNITLAYIESL